ncbi:metallophosphoesterase [Pelovirga terrestris]|uniref:Metallophosphoesterase n=1 Tax=Pelovirga terrestris TaxID=2771352 RepID=A0A8J6UKU4_9BACT|nr:metallophosphoesterase [Pelovirga terrestris]MBD1399992.1 metallophosphoesterase [Pelovirga terrestris]
MSLSVDIIGDVHGRADELEALLKKLGYREHSGSYRHSQRTALFLGDLIDRGKDNARVVGMVRAMIDHGQATAIMGNHEYNAICYHTEHPETGKPLREHSAKNRNQHIEFLREYEGKPGELRTTIDWFKALPLFVETSSFRAVHATWHPDHILAIQQQLNRSTINDEFLLRASVKHSPEHRLIEDTLKGMEIRLPQGECFHDKDDHQRTEIRTRWWLTEANTYQDAAMVAEDTLEKIPTVPFTSTDGLIGYGLTEPPLFIGHYWLTGKPQPLTANIGCLDYSVAKEGGALCAYRFEGEPELSVANFVSVERIK